MIYENNLAKKEQIIFSRIFLISKLKKRILFGCLGYYIAQPKTYYRILSYSSTPYRYEDKLFLIFIKLKVN